MYGRVGGKEKEQRDALRWGGDFELSCDRSYFVGGRSTARYFRLWPIVHANPSAIIMGKEGLALLFRVWSQFRRLSYGRRD